MVTTRRRKPVRRTLSPEPNITVFTAPMVVIRTVSSGSAPSEQSSTRVNAPKRNASAVDDGDDTVTIPSRPLKRPCAPRSRPRTEEETLEAITRWANEVTGDCCMPCLHLGGKAAFQCFSTGESACARCKKRGADIAKRCHQPTTEDIARMDRRCTRCKDKGNKVCDEKEPCGGCIKQEAKDRSEGKQSFLVENCILDKRVRKQLASLSVQDDERSPVGEAIEDEHINYDEEPSYDNIDDPYQGEETNVEEHVENVDEDETTTSIAAAVEETHGDIIMESNESSPSPALVSSVAEQPTSTDPSNIDDEVTELKVRKLRHSSEPSETANNRRRSRRSCAQIICYKEENMVDEGNFSDVHESSATDDDEEVYISQNSESESGDEDTDASEESGSDHEAFESDDEEGELESPAKRWKKLGLKAFDTGKNTGSLSRLPKRVKQKGGPSRYLKKPPGEVIDQSLPPLNDIYDIFADMVANAVKLGFCDALKSLERPINIGTLCSGTEAPLVAMNLISEALSKAGLPPLQFEHHFSAEIESIKQSYIERNFGPRTIFRDVREFIPEDTITATTAYGAEEVIPSGLDIIIAGFVCKNLSSLNSHKMGLSDKGESGDTFRALLSYSKRFSPSIVLIENVQSDEGTWNDVVSMWDEIGYEAEWVYCDTKSFYIPQTRQRMYMIAIKRELFGKSVSKAANQWRETMQQLQRKCSVPYEAFLTKTLQESSNHIARSSEPDWALCKLRYDHIRSEERLGNLRPITQWSANGTVRPPDFANKRWYNSQSSRVWDAIDVAHLQGVAQSGSDSLYKMASWDVSQNVDRFKDKLGILGCITPNGCNFATNRQQALNGTQLLIMQGQPVDKLLFANETQRNCQDLAGNAMTTTVIGASLISALICGIKSFRAKPSPSLQNNITAKIPTMPRVVLDKPAFMDTHMIPEAQFDCLDMAELASDGWLSSRLCNCEGDRALCDMTVRVCSACKHTACSDCAGNPKHKYHDLDVRRTITPDMFIRKWRSKFPARLKLDQLPTLPNLSSKQLAEKDVKAFWKRVKEASVESTHFHIGDLVRQDNTWKVTYTSSEAVLELGIGKHIEWLLFVKCLPAVPGNSRLRKMLEQPVARGRVKSSLMDLEWHVFLHHPSNHTLRISGSSERSRSGRNREGLADFSDETVPETLIVQSTAKGTEALVGKYDYLPYCGTASHNLYKKRSADPEVFIFSDPNPIGPENGLVFSEDCRQKHWGDVRITLARLDLSWRPSHVESGKTYSVDVIVPGSWTPVVMKLSSPHVPISASALSAEAFTASLRNDCSHAVSVLEVKLQERIRIQEFREYFWVLERAARLLPDLSIWQAFKSDSAVDCMCAPTQPPIHWNVNDKVATPHEERQAAARFERAIKTRRKIFEILPSNEHKTTKIEVGVNISSLVHRARGRLTHLGPVRTSWRLLTDHTNPASKHLPKFKLLDNSRDETVDIVPVIKTYLRGAQPKAFSWMRSQELGKTLTITEVEEAIDSRLEWRAEAQAQLDVNVRGGVLADLPSFGKTVTTIALIQNEFEQYTPDEILESNRALITGLPGRIDVAATLIVCPRHIAQQWRTEFKSFLKEKYEDYEAKVIMSFADLQKLTIDDVKNSRVIIISWKVLCDDKYIAHLARFAAIPEPVTTSCRAFNAGLSRIAQDIGDRLEDLENMEFADFDASLDVLLEDRLQRTEFQAVLPLKVQHGKAYKSYEAPAAKNRSAGAPKKAASKRKSTAGSTTHQVPLLHLFRWNRIVVDEYHYLNDRKNIENGLVASSVKRIAALKRWVLSGTPALTNFSDVNEIASFLDVKLGRDVFGDGSATTQLEKGLIKDQTSVENFLSRTQLMSHQWHQARHDRAQNFLNQFVRQNEPSLQHIACSEILRPVELNVAHHTVYLELSQHLDSQRMQIKKLNNKSGSDRQNRLNQSLDNFLTAEAALLHYALQFKTSGGESGLDSLVRDRSAQRRETEADLMRLMAGFEGYQQDPRLMKSVTGITAKDDSVKVYERLKADIRSNWLGDEDASAVARKVLEKAQRKPNTNGFLKKKTKECFRRLLSDTRDRLRELTDRIRSERFVNNIKDRIFPALFEDAGHESLICDAPACKGEVDLTKLRLLYECGHLACDDCLVSRTDEERCVATGCGIYIRGNLIQASELGTTSEKVVGRSFGKKLDAVAELIKKTPHADQVLVFAPNEKTIRALREVFSYYKISYQTAEDDIEKFKTDTGPERKKVLVLDQGSESAAGINLVNANHIFFVAPLLVDSQVQYDAAMAQAEARSRRYGQKKTVHIYHFAALRTIDVDILQHRHRRKDVLATSTEAKLPPPLADREKTKLVKNDAGQVALVPVSLLGDETARRVLGISGLPKSFTSLINFSDNFDDGCEDDV